MGMGWELQDERTNEQAERKHRTKPKAYNERRASADRDEIIINKIPKTITATAKPDIREELRLDPHVDHPGVTPYSYFGHTSP